MPSPETIEEVFGPLICPFAKTWKFPSKKAIMITIRKYTEIPNSKTKSDIYYISEVYAKVGNKIVISL